MITIYSKVIFAIAIFFTGFIGAYKYQHYKYEAIIEKDKRAQADDLIRANLKTQEVERKYNSLAFNYNIELEKRKNELDKMAANNRSVISTRGLYVSGVCEKSVPSSSSTSGNTATNSATIRLSDTVSQYLNAEAERADNAALMAQAGHAYAMLMQQFISEQLETTKK